LEPPWIGYDALPGISAARSGPQLDAPTTNIKAAIVEDTAVVFMVMARFFSSGDDAAPKNSESPTIAGARRHDNEFPDRCDSSGVSLTLGDTRDRVTIPYNRWDSLACTS
jgi:hypothetical protein